MTTAEMVAALDATAAADLAAALAALDADAELVATYLGLENVPPVTTVVTEVLTDGR